MNNCPCCGAPIGDKLEICPYCGSVIPKAEKEETKLVVKKEAEEEDSLESFSYRIPTLPTRKRDLTKSTAALLALFLGAIGVDQFYVGNNGAGIILLLITVCSAGWGAILTGFIALIHFIQFLAMTDEEFDRKYNY